MKGKALKNIIITGLLTICLAAGLFVPPASDEVSAASRLSTPSYSLTHVYKGIKISWKSVPNATYYKVYKRSSNGKWKVIKKVRKGSALRYTDKKASKCNASYRFQVRAFNSKNSSILSSKGKTIKAVHRFVLKKKVAGTCTTKNRKIYACKYCSKTKTIYGRYNHRWVRTSYREATCQQNAYGRYLCTRCGKHKINNGEFANHNYTSWKVIKSPNTKTGYNGYHTRKCKTCGVVAKAPIIDKSPIVNEALKYVGNRFKLHGNSLNNGIDCSHFVYQILKRTCSFDKPYRKSTRWTMYGTKVSSLSKAKPGDVLVFKGHLAIYMKTGQVIHCSRKLPYPNGGVRITCFGSNTKMINFFEDKRHEKFLGIRRFKPTVLGPYQLAADGVSYDEELPEGITEDNEFIVDEEILEEIEGLEETSEAADPEEIENDDVIAPSEDELTSEELEELHSVETLEGLY